MLAAETARPAGRHDVVAWRALDDRCGRELGQVDLGNHDLQPRHKRDQSNGIIRYFKSSNELPSKKQR
jgi:hypothetical protein